VLSPFRIKLAAGVSLGLAAWLWPSAWRFAAPALSPYLAIGGILALRSVSVAALLAAPMIAAAILRPRFWCRHLCPGGLISQSCGKLRGARAAVRKPADSFSWPPARFIVLATLGGAVLQYPVFLWLDPLALFGGFFNVTRLSAAAVLSAAGLPLLILVSVLFPGAWCARICPLGGTQDLLAMLRFRNGRAPAFGVRRAFIALGAGAAFSALSPRTWAAQRRDLRPPGSVDEVGFRGGCIRCGSCARACPTRIIQPAVGPGDVSGLLAPRLRFSGPDYCLQDCNLCGRVCPTGVIRPLPLEEKNRHVIGVAAIDLSACLLTREVECGVCVPRCPHAAIVDGFDYETYKVVVEVLRDRCNGCGACVGICPPKVIAVEPV
jgi:ferredoxin